MDQPALESRLADLGLPGIRFFASIDSTNDEAWRWFDAGTLHGALVVADEQTAGRGRFDRKWVTVPGSSLAFSIIMFSPPLEAKAVNRLVGLAALSICNALRGQYDLSAQIKWPNDILLDQKKIAGILTETRWEGERLMATVLGIGINIAPESVDPEHLPPLDLPFPATCVETVLGQVVDRWQLLHDILKEMNELFPHLSSASFIHQWERYLAYRGQWVELFTGMESEHNHHAIQATSQVGKLIGLTQDGSLKLLAESGVMLNVPVGEIHLKPARIREQSHPPD